MKMKPYRLIYQEDMFDIEIMDVRYKERITVDDSGKCKYEIYERKEDNKKLQKIECTKKLIKEECALALLEEVADFIRDATGVCRIVDDCSGYSVLKYPGVEIKASRELVREDGTSLDTIIYSFKEKYFDK